MRKKYDEPTEFDRYVHHMIWDEVLRQASEKNVGFCVSDIKKEAMRDLCYNTDNEEKFKRLNEIRENAHCVLCTLSHGGCGFCRTLGMSLDDGRCLGGLYDRAWRGDIKAIKEIRDLI